MANLHGIIGATNALSSFAKGYYDSKLKMLEMDRTEKRWNDTFQMQKQTLKMGQATADRSFRFEQQKYADGAELRQTQSNVMSAQLASTQFNLATARAAKNAAGPALQEFNEALGTLDYSDPYVAMSGAHQAKAQILGKYPNLDANGRAQLNALYENTINSPIMTASRTVLSKESRKVEGGRYVIRTTFKDNHYIDSEPIDDVEGFQLVISDKEEKFWGAVEEAKKNWRLTLSESKKGYLEAVNSGSDAESNFRLETLLKEQEAYVLNAVKPRLESQAKFLKTHWGEGKGQAYLDRMTGGISSHVEAQDANANVTHQTRVNDILFKTDQDVGDGYSPHGAFMRTKAEINNLVGQEAVDSLAAWKEAAELRFGANALENLKTVRETLLGDFEFGLDTPATYDPAEGEFVGPGTGDIDLPPIYERKVGEAASGQWRHLKAKGAPPPIYLEKIKQAARGDWMNSGEWK